MSEISEKDILKDILNNINFFYKNKNENIEEGNYEKKDIFVNINKLNNTYFREDENTSIIKKYMEIVNINTNNYDNYNDNDNNNLSDEITEFKYFIQNKLDNICEHEWVFDSIDITPDMSKNICYCDICKITKM
jgi:hypothetical protein